MQYNIIYMPSMSGCKVLPYVVEFYVYRCLCSFRYRKCIFIYSDEPAISVYKCVVAEISSSGLYEMQSCCQCCK